MIELMKKTRICEEFMKTGSCKYGDKCTFAHGYGVGERKAESLEGETEEGAVAEKPTHTDIYLLTCR